jgi:hypothetical protein
MEIRRQPSKSAQILLAYLPTSHLEGIHNKASCRRANANLYHACMKMILQPLVDAGESGVEMASGDGTVCRCHPIFAIFVGDYPEQSLVTCCKHGKCPKCTVPRTDLGAHEEFEPQDLEQVLEALSQADQGPTAFRKACKDAGIKPVHEPFWADLPYSSPFLAIAPDMLHQLYQGVVKHVISWCIEAFGAEEIDARCRRMPPNHSLRFFRKGISTLGQVSGTEHKDICRILLGLIIGLPLPNGLSSARLVCAVRGLLDFLYIAQYPAQTDETLLELDKALSMFHDNKAIFLDLGIQKNFNLPKLHGIGHYPGLFTFFGTLDNSNTEHTERLHIDLAKDAYRATNHCNEYVQMTKWLEREEKIKQFFSILQKLSTGPPSPPPLPLPRMERSSTLTLTKHPSVKSCTWRMLEEEYGATSIRWELANFVVKWTQPSLPRARVRAAAATILFQFQHVPVWHKVKFLIEDAQHNTPLHPPSLDVAHAKPDHISTQHQHISGRFDTVLVGDGTGDDVGVEGTYFTSYICILH